MLYDYSSIDATSSEQCSNNDCPQAIVYSNPTSGSQVNFPTYVTLTSDVAGATIRFTIDGTAPDTLSEIYTGPILIESAGVILRAIAHADGCAQGSEPALTATFSNSAFPFVASYACDTPDNAGQWEDFAPNGINDHHWVLQFILAGAETIKRLELYQLDAAGNWTTGQVWSTDSPINPAELDAPFEVFPLLVFDTAVQVWSAYQSSLGVWGPGTITWDLYGDTVVPASGLFRLDIILGDDTKLTQTIAAVCTVTPPVCIPPDAPTLTAKCDGAVDVTFAGTVGQDYVVYYKSDICLPGEGWQEGASGNLDVSPKTVEVSGLTQGCLYDFYVSVASVGCGFRDSNQSSVTPLVDATVSISTNKTLVDPNESFTISWNSNNIGTAVCGGCLAGEVSLNQSMGCKAGNVAGSQAQSQAVCGIYTYQITGCNTCGTVVASVQVEVRCPATCPEEDQPVLVGLGGSGTFMCERVDGCGLELFYQTQWNGIMSGIPCAWAKPSSSGVAGCIRHINGNIYEGYVIDVEVRFVDAASGGPYWRMMITAQGFSGAPLVWEGRKLFGTDPFGVYTKVDGCASGPATLTAIPVP